MDDKFKGRIADFVSDKQRTIGNTFRKLQRKGFEDDFLVNIDSDEISEIILSMYPNSEKSITNLCYTLGAYAKYLYEHKLLPDTKVYNAILGIDRKDLWNLAKPNASARFLSHKKYLDLIEETKHEDMNAEYYTGLIQCLYEGIYSDDLSSLVNLCSSNINMIDYQVVVNNSDGEEYTINISKDLASNLLDLGDLHSWERINHYREYIVETSGKYEDSCFKVENRNGEEYTEEQRYLKYARAYRQKLRKVLNEFGGLENVRPKQIFVSGIMYRVKQKLKEHNITVKEALQYHSRNPVVMNIIQNELDYCHYKITVGAFREMVNGYADIFDL